ncbi:MAG: pyrroline-5-carboxylate reductase [Thermanaeromonas sp.]|uniref:pyrroline-5-carboxylate reductase n=1 Tax=Thermanaeromonas sp. TaxID=2003697 RepID=UPI00243FC044|nr:pyrroline-5-carboxylate reductase [Thermanaeromonas sp.]MCG0276969.1 pyrroline-5-carboxylate reductase [Thermanaeromonas sp.]
MNQTIGFIGAGAMGGALIAGLIKSGLISPGKIYAYDICRERLENVGEEYGIQIAYNSQEVLDKAEVIILAVKPQNLPEAVQGLNFKPSHLIISVAAGIALKQLMNWLGPNLAIIRAVPNTPALVGEGITALAANPVVSTEQKELALAIFGSVGRAVLLPEEQLDAVTGLSGSGPAYAYLMIEALADGGVWCGLSRDVALELAARTLLGAAKMVLQTGEHPAVLKDRVASPGGTTIAGLEVLERRAVRGALMEAVKAGAERARALSEGHKE